MIQRGFAGATSSGPTVAQGRHRVSRRPPFPPKGFLRMVLLLGSRSVYPANAPGRNLFRRGGFSARLKASRHVKVAVFAHR